MMKLFEHINFQRCKPNIFRLLRPLQWFENARLQAIITEKPETWRKIGCKFVAFVAIGGDCRPGLVASIGCKKRLEMWLDSLGCFQRQTLALLFVRILGFVRCEQDGDDDEIVVEHINFQRCKPNIFRLLRPLQWFVNARLQAIIMEKPPP